MAPAFQRTESTRSSQTKQQRPHGKREPKLSRLHRPPDMPLETWQIELRKQFGRQQAFTLANVGPHPFFSDFDVTNPESKNTYRVAIRGTRPGENYCSCPDFATNTLGTCKHIEFTLYQLESKRGGKSALQAGFQPDYSEVYLQYGARREPRFRPGCDCPVELARLSGRFFGPEGALLPEKYASFEDFLKKASTGEHELRCHGDVLDFVAQVRDAERRREVLRQAFPRGIHSAAFNKLLRVPLYDYQREGALFAATAGRTLIGDEMGLGKTVQAIAAAEIMAKNFGVERVLIVCPTSLKHQWQREIARFIDRPTTVIGGLQPRRQELFAADSFFKITNYDTVQRDLEFIRAWGPDLVILDEAQRIKNWKTRTAQAVKKVSSPYAIVLTGTPLENRLEELVSIVQFVDQHRLGPTFRFLHDHQVQDDHGRVIGYRNLDRISKTLEPILIRRHKNQVLDQLPERIDKNFFVQMTPQQMAHHEENKEIVARVVQKWRRYRYLSEADQRRLMIALQNMRMSCDSSYLLDQTSDHGLKADELATLLDEVYETPNTKVVIFSQWVRMHELLVRRFEKRRWQHVMFHGGVPGRQRPGLIDRFREDRDCRAFLSTDAGGVGLNLQFASVVVNMDLPWNPAVLEQRIGRVHRLGQKQPVQVFNFVAQGTIEEGMLGVLKFKKSLFAGALDGGDKEVFLGGSRLNRFMESVEKTTTSIPVQAERDEEDGHGAEIMEEPAVGEVTPRRRAAGDAALPAVVPASRPVAAEPWSGLVQNGLAFLQQLAAVSHGTDQGADGSARTLAAGASIVSRDERTGEPYIRLPMPQPEVIDQALQAFGALLASFRK